MEGPIGVDNSEVINLEMERELKRRTKNLPNHSSTEVEDEEDQLNEEDRENLKNDKLLKRLYKAANIEHQQAVRFEEVNEDENVIDN
jgi:hypothetical protein